MIASRPLHVVVTMDCQPAATRAAPEGPRTWNLSARAIDGFCTRLLNAGFPPTLLVAPSCADAHAPLLEALQGSGVELGLLIQPQTLEGAGFHRHLGQYGRPEQEQIVRLSIRRFQDALGERPLSVRSALFSASDDTFGVLYDLGFRQGSLSSPGRRVTKHAAVWSGAVPDAHLVDREHRLRAGTLPFLEIPVTTDATQVRGAVSPDLVVESGSFEAWHRPLIEGQLQRMEQGDVPFRALCVATRNCFDYHGGGDKPATALAALVDYLISLEGRYEVIPTTMARAHTLFYTLTLA